MWFEKDSRQRSTHTDADGHTCSSNHELKRRKNNTSLLSAQHDFPLLQHTEANPFVCFWAVGPNHFSRQLPLQDSPFFFVILFPFFFYTNRDPLWITDFRQAVSIKQCVVSFEFWCIDSSQKQEEECMMPPGPLKGIVIWKSHWSWKKSSARVLTDFHESEEMTRAANESRAPSLPKMMPRCIHWRIAQLRPKRCGIPGRSMHQVYNKTSLFNVWGS